MKGFILCKKLQRKRLKRVKSVARLEKHREHLLVPKWIVLNLIRISDLDILKWVVFSTDHVNTLASIDLKSRVGDLPCCQRSKCLGHFPVRSAEDVVREAKGALAMEIGDWAKVRSERPHERPLLAPRAVLESQDMAAALKYADHMA
jgi:hypothetical protein